jgi:hypothetical protein
MRLSRILVLKMILYSKLYERPGNDAWLKDRIELVNDELGLYLEHKVRWSGWGEDIKENHTIELDPYDIEASQKKINLYIENHSLYHKHLDGTEEGIKINLQ